MFQSSFKVYIITEQICQFVKAFYILIYFYCLCICGWENIFRPFFNRRMKYYDLQYVFCIEYVWSCVVMSAPLCKRKRKKSNSVLWQKPLYTEKIQKAMWQHKNATKHFDNTTIADRLRTVSWGNDSHPTGVVKPVYGIPTFPLTEEKLCN